jgi:MinD-like ATPase involved in chromosome partitioning or flagellar assembly/CheY-like chemotaxis protein
MNPKKVLIVDKDKASRGYLAKTLKMMNHTVDETSLGKEGLILAWGGRPDLIIVDPVLDDLSGEDMLRKLRKDQRSENIPAIALSSDLRPLRQQSCMDAGFNKYITKSMEAIPVLLEMVNHLLDEPKPTDDRAGGLVIVFLSSKGGIGTSSLCANLAQNIASLKRDLRVAVVDAVLPIGSIAPIVGYTGDKNLVAACAMDPTKPSTTDMLNALPVLPKWQFHLLAGSPDPQSAIKLHANRIESTVRSLKLSYDFVMIDLGRTLSRISLPLIKMADVIVLVTGNDLNTVTLTRIVWDYLSQQGVTQNHMYTVLNRAVGIEGLSKPQIEERLQLRILTAVPYMGEDLVMANNLHVPLAAQYPNHSATMILKEAAKQIVDQAQKIRTYSG